MRKAQILLEITQLIPSQYNTFHQCAQWQIEGDIGKGGYGIPVSLPPDVRRAKAAELLEDQNFLYQGGVSRFLCVLSIRYLLSWSKANRLPTAIKYSHWSIRQSNWRNFQTNIHAAVHPFRASRQNTADHFHLPSLKKFPMLGGATTVSFVRLLQFLVVYICSPLTRNRFTIDLSKLVEVMSQLVSALRSSLT